MPKNWYTKNKRRGGPGNKGKGVVRLKKAKWVLFLPVLALLVVLLGPPVQAAGAPRAVLSAKDGGVRIFGEVDGGLVSGSGFLVTNTSSGAMVVTNYHVVQGASETALYYDGNGPIDLVVVAVSEGQDLCLLQTPKALPGMAPLALADTVEIGEAVYALGYPGGSDVFSSDLALTKDKMALTSGLVSALTDTDLLGDQSQSVQLIQTNADINHGNSGGPLLNEQGQVIGVNTLALNDFGITGVNAAIHVNELRGFLQAQGVAVGRGITSNVLLWAVVVLVVLLLGMLALVFFLIRNEKKAAARRAAQQLAAAGYPSPAGPVQAQAPPMAPAQQVANNGQSPAAFAEAVPPAAQTTVQAMPHSAPPATTPQEATNGQPQGQTAQWAAAAPEVPAPVPPQATTAQQVPPAPPAVAPQGVNVMPPQGWQTGFGPAGIPAAVTPVSAPALSAPVPPGISPVSAAPSAPPVVPPVAQAAAPLVPPAPTATPQTGPVPVQNWAPTAPPPPVWPAGNPAQPAAPRPKKKIRVWPIVTAIALCLVLALGITAAVGIGTYYRIFNEVDTAVAAEDYAAVVALYDQNPWLGRVRDEAEQPYSNGMMLLTQGKYKDAAAALSQLGDYKEAQKATAYAKAIITEDPYEQYLQFKELGDYRDCAKRIEQTMRKVFAEAKELIAQSEFEKAKTYLTALPNGYPQRMDCLNLIDEWQNATISPAYMQTFAEDCNALGINIPTQVGEDYIDFFMAGYWETGSGWYFYWYNDNDQLTGAYGDWHFDTNMGFQYFSTLYTGKNGLYRYEDDIQPLVCFIIKNYYQVIAYYGGDMYFLERY